jgi:ribosomal protein L31E
MTDFNFDIMCPYDMHYEIYSFLDLKNKSNIKYLNKTFYELWKKNLKAVKIIKKYLKKYCYFDLEKIFLNDVSNEITNKIIELDNKNYRNNLYKPYLFQYSKKDLINYPEFVIKKYLEKFDLDKADKCKTWINNNLNKDLDKRTRLDINRFFVENEISIKEIFYTGW